MGGPRELEKSREALAVVRAQRERIYGTTGVVAVFGLIFAVCLTIAIPLWLVSRGILAESSLDWIVPTAMLTTYFGGMFAVMMWQHSTPKIPRATSSVPAPPHHRHQSGQASQSTGTVARATAPPSSTT